MHVSRGTMYTCFETEGFFPGHTVVGLTGLQFAGCSFGTIDPLSRKNLKSLLHPKRALMQALGAWGLGLRGSRARSVCSFTKPGTLRPLSPLKPCKALSPELFRSDEAPGAVARDSRSGPTAARSDRARRGRRVGGPNVEL